MTDFSIGNELKFMILQILFSYIWMARSFLVSSIGSIFRCCVEVEVSTPFKDKLRHRCRLHYQESIFVHEDRFRVASLPSDSDQSSSIYFGLGTDMKDKGAYFGFLL